MSKKIWTVWFYTCLYPFTFLAMIGRVSEHLNRANAFRAIGSKYHQSIPWRKI